jgi:hypothetical protein
MPESLSRCHLIGKNSDLLKVFTQVLEAKKRSKNSSKTNSSAAAEEVEAAAEAVEALKAASAADSLGGIVTHATSTADGEANEEEGNKDFKGALSTLTDANNKKKKGVRREKKHLSFIKEDDNDDDDEEDFNLDSNKVDENGIANDEEIDDTFVVNGIAGRQLIGMVEVAWEGKTQREFFPKPAEAFYLTTTTKRLFMDKARLLTTDKRLELMFGSTDLFIAEMDWVHTLANTSRLYRLIGRNLNNLKLVMYSLVVLLNINVLMSPPSLARPFDSLWNDSQFENLKRNERVSLFLTFGLGALNFVGYFGESVCQQVYLFCICLDNFRFMAHF